MASAKEFRLLAVWGKIAAFLADTGSDVWSLPQCKMGILAHEWAMVTWMGPSVGSSATQQPSTPLALRRSPLWEMLPVLSYPGQVGYLPTLHTSECPGCPVTGYPSAPAAFKHCGAPKSIIVRVVGQGPRKHEASKDHQAQRAKVEYLPCCAALTRVAAPPSYSVGE